MSTVLTNGIIIPENGSRNWGGDLANNWNILDVHVGYMTDVKNRVTTLENSVTTLETSVAENTANIQNNASNISALQTSKQDVIEDLETIRSGANAGATAVQPNALNNYVDLSSEQTIAGLKKFSGTIVGIDNFNIQGGSDWDGGARLTLNKKTESMSAILQTFSNTDSSAYVYDVNNFYPYKNNNNNLGSSSNKWKTLNGINPGALSLPNCAESVEVTSQVVNNNGVYQYTNNLYDGWLVVTALADNLQIANQYFECRAVRSTDNALTTHIALRLNETTAMRFTNFTKFAYVKLFKILGNV